MTTRGDLYVLLEAAMADGVQVYDHPADLLSLPAVIIQPADPWVTPATMKKGGGLYRVNLEVVCMVARVEPETALPALEALVDAVVAAFHGSRFRFGEASRPEPLPVGEVDSSASTITITTALEGGLT